MDSCQYEVGKFMYLYSKGFLPNSFRRMFTLTNQIHSYKTRNSNSFYTFSYRTNIRKFSIHCHDPKCFNSLPLDIRSTTSIGLFCEKLKGFLRLIFFPDNYFYGKLPLLFFVYVFFFFSSFL